MVSVQKKDHDSLRFLWFHNVNKQPDVTILTFTHVIFGVNSSPFLLNATKDDHNAEGCSKRSIPSMWENFFLPSMLKMSVSAKMMLNQCTSSTSNQSQE